jgi:hypothetical protein
MLAIAVLVVRDRQPQAREAVWVRNSEVATLEPWPALSEAAGRDGFLPLPGAGQLPAAEDVDMVRVELPRSAMMQVGIAVSPERAWETVQADVMLGADGMARAVRFLEATGSD